MTLRPEPLSADALAYAARHSAPDDAVLRDVEAQAEALGGLSQMQLGPGEGALLTLLARLLGARDVLEVGTFLGYGTISLARGVAPGGRVLSLEVDPERAAAARENVRRAGLEDRVEIREGPGAESLAGLPAQPRFDLAFLDADKRGYPAYYELILERLRPGGLLVIDNTLYGGRVLDPDGEPTAAAMDALNDRIAADERVDGVLLPIADGMTLVRRRD